MKFIKQIKEGESIMGTFIGYRFIQYSNFDDSYTTGLQVSLNLYFFIIKIEIIPYERI